MVKYKKANKPNMIKLSVKAKCHHGIRHPNFLMSKFKSRRQKPVKRCTMASKCLKIPKAVLSNLEEMSHKAKATNGTKEDDERNRCKCQKNSYNHSHDGFETFSTEAMNFDSYLDDESNSNCSESDMEGDSEPLYERSLNTTLSSEASMCELITAENGNRIAPADVEEDDSSDQWVTEDTENDVSVNGNRIAPADVEDDDSSDQWVTEDNENDVAVNGNGNHEDDERTDQWVTDTESDVCPPIATGSMKKVLKQDINAQDSKEIRSKNRRQRKRRDVEPKSHETEENSQRTTENEWETLDESSYERTSESQTDSSPRQKPSTPQPQKVTHRIYSENANSFILVLDHPARLSMRGKIEVSVLWGCLSVNGFRLKPQAFTPVYAPSTSSSILISTFRDVPAAPSSDSETKAFEEFWKSQDIHLFSTSNDITKAMKKTVGLQCRRLSNTACSYVERFFPNVFEINHKVTGFFSPERADQYGCQFYDATHSRIKFIRSDRRWEEIVNDVTKFTQTKDTPPRIIVCGGKTVGKSTFGRYLLNSLLNVCEKVTFMDGDPGQSEFTPPGLVSLLEITEPCFGPTFTHLQDTKLSFFVGGTTVANCPSHFIDCIAELCKYYAKHDTRKQPLLINTMGWNKGLGVALLMDMIHMVQPTHLIQINSELHKSKNFFELTLNNISHTPGWEFEFPVVDIPYVYLTLETMIFSKYELPQITTREINLLSYFSRFQESSSKFQTINRLRTIKVPWSTVALHVCQTDVLNSQILYVYNASVVALCRCDENMIISSDDPTLPKFIRDIPVCKFFGYGIIRGISMEEKCFYVITFLDSESLMQVNALLKGTIELPKELLLEQDVGGPIPYMLKRNPSLNLRIGHKPVPRRNFIGKPKRMSPKTTGNQENPNLIPLMSDR